MAEIAAPTWFPGATRVLGESAGPFVGGGWKITHHTTEGSTAQGAIAALPLTPRLAALHCGMDRPAPADLPAPAAGARRPRAAKPSRRLGDEPRPHDPDRARRLRSQHRPLVRRALPRHRRPVPLDRGQHGRPAQADARRLVRQPAPAVRPRLPRGSGHHGHVHVPGNDHSDPGRGFRIGLVLDFDNRPHRNFTDGVQGADVRAFQRAINRRARGCNRPDRRVKVDGDRRSRDARARRLGGVRSSASASASATTGAAASMRGSSGSCARPGERTDAQKKRARGRRRRHCNPD